MIEIFCYGAGCSLLRHYSKPTNACQAIWVPETSLGALQVLGVVDDCSPMPQHEVRDQWLNDRDLLLWRRLFSTLRHYSKLPMLARLLWGPQRQLVHYEC
jgi:hypothetical protein